MSQTSPTYARRRRLRLVRASILVLILLPTAAALSQALVRDGRALDSSLRLGSGGYNDSRGWDQARTLEVRRYDPRVGTVKPHHTSAYGGWNARNHSSWQSSRYRASGASRSYSGSAGAYRQPSTRVNTRVR